MDFLREASLQLIVAATAFILGLLLNRAVRTSVYFRARKFWRPLATKDLAIVLGDGFSGVSSLEASGLVGQGDLLASAELISHFSAMGLPPLQPEFADKAVGVDPGGRALRRNLVILGGPDANTLTKACLDRLKCSYRLEEAVFATAESGSAADATTLVWRLPKLRPTIRAKDQATVYEPVVLDGQIVRDYGVIVRTRNPFLFERRQPKRNLFRFWRQREKWVVLMFGCYGLGTYAAALFSKEKAFLDLVKNSEEDIECIVRCDVFRKTPQGVRHIDIIHHRPGDLAKLDFLKDEPPAPTAGKDGKDGSA